MMMVLRSMSMSLLATTYQEDGDTKVNQRGHDSLTIFADRLSFLIILLHGLLTSLCYDCTCIAELHRFAHPRMSNLKDYQVEYTTLRTMPAVLSSNIMGYFDGMQSVLHNKKMPT